MTGERNKLSQETVKLKEKLEKTEHKLATANDIEHWEEILGKLQTEITNLTQENDKLKSFIKIREESVKSLENELQYLRRTLSIQTHYENDLNSKGKGANTNRDLIQSLYHDIGKGQVNSHNLSLTLAEKHREIEDLTQEIEVLRKYKNEISSQIEQLLIHVDNMTIQSQQKDNEISELLQRIDEEINCRQQYENQVDKLAAALSQMESSINNTISEKSTELSDVNQLLAKTQSDNTIAQRRIDTLQQIISQQENANVLSKQEIDTEWNKIHMEQKNLKYMVQENTSLSIQVKDLTNRLSLLKQEHQNLIQSSNAAQNQLASQNSSLAIENTQIKNNIQDLEQELSINQNELFKLNREHNEAISAIEQAMSAIKELSIKYNQSKEMNESLQLKLQESLDSVDLIKRSKEHISTAVLDALHKERLKSTKLEKFIHEMSLDNRYMAFTSSIPMNRAEGDMPTTTPSTNALQTMLTIADSSTDSIQSSIIELTSEVDSDNSDNLLGDNKNVDSPRDIYHNNENETLLQLDEESVNKTIDKELNNEKQLDFKYSPYEPLPTDENDSKSSSDMDEQDAATISQELTR